MKPAETCGRCERPAPGELYRCWVCNLKVCRDCLETVNKVGEPNLCRRTCAAEYRAGLRK